MKLRLMFIIILGVFLVSCSPQRRLHRLLKHHPELMDSTIIDYDTTIIDIPAVHSDSVVHIETLRQDTFIMVKERLRVKTYIHKDSIFIEGECLGIKDTIVQIEHHPVAVYQEDEGWNWWKIAMILLVAVVVLERIFNYGKRIHTRYIKSKEKES